MCHIGLVRMRIRHRSHHFATQSSHCVDRAGWQAKIASIEFWIPWHNAHTHTSWTSIRWKREKSWPLALQHIVLRTITEALYFVVFAIQKRTSTSQFFVAILFVLLYTRQRNWKKKEPKMPKTPKCMAWGWRCENSDFMHLDSSVPQMASTETVVFWIFFRTPLIKNTTILDAFPTWWSLRAKRCGNCLCSSCICNKMCSKY